jgi:DNA-binding MarR family transcriptional regulator
MSQFEKEMRRLNRLSLESEMSPLTYRVMAAFIEIADKDGFPPEITVTIRKIGSTANVATKTVYSAIKVLIKMGLIKPIKSGRRGVTNVYQVTYS